MFFGNKKKKAAIERAADRVMRARLKTAVDPDLEWYCPECQSESKHLGGSWIHCPTCGNRDDGMTRKLRSITGCSCVWCHTSIDPSSILRDDTAMCKKCKQLVPVKYKTSDLSIGKV